MDNTASEHSMKCSVLSDTRALLGFRLCEFNTVQRCVNLLQCGYFASGQWSLAC